MYPERMILLGALIFALLVLGNLIFLDYQINHLPSQTITVTPSPSPHEIPASESASLNSEGCDTLCQTVFQEYIDKKVTDAKTDLLRRVSLTTPSILTVPSPTPSFSPLPILQPSNFYVDFGVSGSTQLTDWTDVPGAQIKINSSSYPGAKGFYFQANLRSDAPDRGTYAKLVNTSNGIDIPGSQINFTGLTSTFKESGSLTLPATDTVVKVQIHSLNGNFAYIDNPKIRIAY